MPQYPYDFVLALALIARRSRPQRNIEKSARYPASRTGANTGLSALLFIAALLCAVPVSAAAETYGRVTIDARGQLHIFTQDRREILSSKEKGQTGFQKAVIAPNRRAVGWLALYPNCCTSYPIPLKLVIYSDGKTHTFTGNDLPVWQWCFLSSGKQVAFEQETVHGGQGIRYELRDVATGRLTEDPFSAFCNPAYSLAIPKEPALENKKI